MTIYPSIAERPFCIPAFSLRNLMLVPYFVLIFCGLTIPSDGGHGILNLKSLSFVATTLCTLLYVCAKTKISSSQIRIFGFLFCSLTFFIIWTLLSVIYSETPLENTIDQFKIFWITLSVVAFSIYMVNDGSLAFPTLLKTVLYINFGYSLFKIMVVIAHMLGVINIWEIATFIDVRFMSMPIFGDLFRLQLSNDIATPFLLFFFLQSPMYGIKWSKKFRFLFCTVSTFSILLSFSRYLIFVGALGVLLHVCTLRLGAIARWIPLFVILCICTVFAIGVDNVYTIIERRLYSTDNAASDTVRTEQISALLDDHEKYPFLGKGLGSSAKDYVRDERIMHSYEVQWIAFLMQFGIVGLILIMIPIALIGIKILSPPFSRPKIALFIMFLSWLLSGFTNPFLISLLSGILYTLFYLAGSYEPTNRHPNGDLPGRTLSSRTDRLDSPAIVPTLAPDNKR